MNAPVLRGSKLEIISSTTAVGARTTTTACEVCGDSIIPIYTINIQRRADMGPYKSSSGCLWRSHQDAA